MEVLGMSAIGTIHVGVNMMPCPVEAHARQATAYSLRNE